MPNATALTFAADDRTTIFLPASSTIPVLSNTPLANISTSYSMYSEAKGISAAATASLTDIAELPRLHILTLVTANVSTGQVYNVWLVAALKSATPSLPVAIINLRYPNKK